MSHLIIEQGGEVGKEISVPASGIKFGRSPANDLVLTDESVMLFQGRFFFKSDGSLWVTDFSAAEKTTVGGEPIDEHPLRVGELVEVGTTAFRVIGARQESDTSGPAPAIEEAAVEEIDLGFKDSESPLRPGVSSGDEAKNAPTLGHRLLQLAVVMLIMLVVAFGVREFLDVKGPPVAPVAEQPRFIAFAYESVRANYKDIFRYYMELSPDGTARIEIDNLGNRHNTKTVTVSKEAMETLSRRLSGSGFFDINRNYVIDSPNTYTYLDLAIYCNGCFNTVKVLNKEMPQDLQRTISILEEFVFKEMDVPSTLLEDEETLIRLATESFKLGEVLFSEREVKVGNLALAIGHYEEALDSLETLDLKPQLNERIKMGLARAKLEQDKRYKDFKFNADRAMRLGDWREADQQLRVLAELIPDREDHRYDTIISMQLEVEEHLR